jgi:hypothetical protein
VGDAGDGSETGIDAIHPKYSGDPVANGCGEMTVAG